MGCSLLTRAAHNVLTKHKLHYLLLVTLVLVVAGALIVQTVESTSSEASIRTVPDAIWWAVTTVTTVGYGDLYPVTPVDRGVAIVFMILGVGIFGLLAASMASFFIERRVEEETEPQLNEILDRLKRIDESLREVDRVKGRKE